MRQLVAAAERFAARHDAIAAEVKLESATAPAILDGNGIDQFVLLKGVAARRGEIVPRRFLEAIDGPTQPVWPQHSSGRLELAQRVVDAANPLASRVIVNRIWQHLFGRGIAAPSMAPAGGAFTRGLTVIFSPAFSLPSIFRRRRRRLAAGRSPTCQARH